MIRFDRTTPLLAIDGKPDDIFRTASHAHLIPERAPMNWGVVWDEVYAAAGTIGDFADALGRKASASFRGGTAGLSAPGLSS